MKPVIKERQRMPKDADDIEKTEAEIEKMMVDLLNAGATEMQVYRQMGFTEREDWDWVRDVKNNLELGQDGNATVR